MIMKGFNGFSLVTRTQLQELFKKGLKNTCAFNTSISKSLEIDFVTLRPVNENPTSYLNEKNEAITDVSSVFSAIEISLTNDKLDLIEILNSQIIDGVNLILFITDNRSLYLNNKVYVMFIKKK